jgi:hypothetical protein
LGGLIHKLEKLFAGLELGDALRRHLNTSARLGVPAHARRALAGTKTAEAADFSLFPSVKAAENAA